MSCPSAFALDEVVTHGAAGPEIGAHIAVCGRCREQIDARRAEAERFAPVADARWRGVVAARATRRSSRRRWLVAATAVPVAMAGALALVLMLRPVTPYVGVKGAPSMSVTVRRGDEVFAVDGSRPVQAGDSLRFVPGAHAPGRFVAIVAVDGTGTVSPFYPADAAGDSVALPPAGQPLPGSIVLDDAPGPERVLIVVTRRPVPARLVIAAARSGGAVPDELASAGAQVLRLDLPKVRRGAGSP